MHVGRVVGKPFRGLVSNLRSCAGWGHCCFTNTRARPPDLHSCGALHRLRPWNERASAHGRNVSPISLPFPLVHITGYRTKRIYSWLGPCHMNSALGIKQYIILPLKALVSFQENSKAGKSGFFLCNGCIWLCRAGIAHGICPVRLVPRRKMSKWGSAPIVQN